MVNEPVTLATLAEHLKVSKTTISKALRNQPGISSGMKRKVRNLARELNYTPNFAGQMLRSEKINTVGALITLDVTNSWLSEMVSCLEDELDKHGQTMLLTLGKNNPDKLDRCIDQLSGGRVSGIIAGPYYNPSSLNSLINLINRKIPVVAFNCMYDLPIDRIQIDLKAGAELAVEYLYQCGHRNIGFLCSPAHVMESFSGSRRAAFQEAMIKHELPLKGKFLIDGPSYVRGGMEAMLNLLDKYPKDELPTAFVCQNDAAADGAMRAIYKRGYKVPEDFSIIGFDNLKESGMTITPLTTIDGAMRQMAEEIVTTLMNKIEEPKRALVVKNVQPTLVERESVATIKA